MMILIGCEESQVICRAFRDAGFEAYSCDLEETRGNSDWHFQDDILNVIPQRRWSLIILHPDCTAMAVSGNSTYGKDMPKHHERIKAIEWTVNLWKMALKHGDRVALENPVSVIFPYLRKLGADVQYVHPWEHGHPEQKKTGFALHNLPRLEETDNVYEYMMTLPKKERERNHYMSPGPNRKRDRSETYTGIGRAVVAQWGKYV
jgi:hypothetical protein